MPKPSNESEIRRRLDAGQTPRDIAADLKVSLRRVYQVRGVERPRETIDDAKVEAIKSAVANGMSRREAAAQFGCARKTVTTLCADLDVVRAKPAGRLPDDTVAHILARSRAGRSTGTIARELDIPPSSVRSVLRHHPNPKLRPGDSIMQAIAMAMERRGLTAHGLAQLIKAPPTRDTLHEYLRGDSTPTTPVASRLLDALGLRISSRD